MLHILAIAWAMAAVCALHPIPPTGAHHHKHLFSAALARLPGSARGHPVARLAAMLFQQLDVG
ncbi:MAG: hypothetical protein ACP5GF_11495, partial [Thiomonas sp.]